MKFYTRFQHRLVTMKVGLQNSIGGILTKTFKTFAWEHTMWGRLTMHHFKSIMAAMYKCTLCSFENFVNRRKQIDRFLVLSLFTTQPFFILVIFWFVIQFWFRWWCQVNVFHWSCYINIMYFEQDLGVSACPVKLHL